MTYTAFDNTQPTTAGSPTPTRQGTIDAIRANLMALRDLLASLGMVQGFDFSTSGGTAEQPANLLYKRGTEWIKLALTWGTTGGEDGQVTKIAFYYSSDSGGVYSGMADSAGEYVMTLTYDSSGFCTAATWGSTP